MSPGPLAWAFHSPRRLGTVAGGGLLGLVLGVGAVSNAVVPRGGPDATPVAAPATPTPGPTAAPVAPVAPPAPAVYGPSAADAEAAAAARKFVLAWLHGPGAASDAAWQATMKPYATGELLAGLRRSDRSRIPEGKVAGSAPEVRTLGEFVNELTVRLRDGRGVDVTVAFDGTTWRVADLDADRASPPR